jgi:hypothetical protein
MAFNDLRSFIDGAARIGELKIVDGAHWDLEIGCLTELMAEQDGPLLLFDNIVGYPKGFRIASTLATPPVFALALGLPTSIETNPKAWRNKTRDLNPCSGRHRPARSRTTSSEGARRSDIFPRRSGMARRWPLHRHRRHGQQDPDSGWVNVGTTVPASSAMIESRSGSSSTSMASNRAQILADRPPLSGRYRPRPRAGDLVAALSA